MGGSANGHGLAYLDRTASFDLADGNNAATEEPLRPIADRDRGRRVPFQPEVVGRWERCLHAGRTRGQEPLARAARGDRGVRAGAALVLVLLLLGVSCE